MADIFSGIKDGVSDVIAERMRDSTAAGRAQAKMGLAIVDSFVQPVFEFYESRLSLHTEAVRLRDKGDAFESKHIMSAAGLRYADKMLKALAD